MLLAVLAIDLLLDVELEPRIQGGKTIASENYSIQDAKGYYEGHEDRPGIATGTCVGGEET